MKKVSIIIPAHNEEKTIGKLLDKIIKIELNQINFEKEIIVVDDGSNDNTANICEKYQKIKLRFSLHPIYHLCLEVFFLLFT